MGSVGFGGSVGSVGSVGSQQFELITRTNLHSVQSYIQCKVCVILHTGLPGVLWLTICVVGGVLWRGVTGVAVGYVAVHVAAEFRSGDVNAGYVALWWVVCRKSCKTLLGQISNSVKVQFTGGVSEDGDFERGVFCNFSDILETRGAGVTNGF